MSPWRQYDRVGDYQIPVASDGAFRTVDRSGTQPITVRPSASEIPPLEKFDGFVASFEERQAAPDRSELSLVFQRERNRSRSVADPQGSGAWTLAFSEGTIGLTERDVLQASNQGTTTDGEWTLPILLSPTQAEVVLASLAHNDAIAERPIPDAADDVIDATASGRNTVTLSVPSRALLSDGDYVVRGFDLRPYAEERWRSDLILVAK
jgi:hypothetical protein